MSSPKATALLTTQGARLLCIDRMVRRAQGATFTELQAAVSVSCATIKRDLMALREELGAPIKHDSLDGRYHVVGPWLGVLASLLEQAGAV